MSNKENQIEEEGANQQMVQDYLENELNFSFTQSYDTLIKSKLGDRPKSIDWEVLSLINEPFTAENEKPSDCLSAVYQTFLKNTNIPIELPVFGLLSYISAFLVKNGSKVKVHGLKDPLELDLWVILLAESGASKTFSHSQIERSIPLDSTGEKAVEANFDSPSGGAGFVQELMEKNRGFYVQDECGQLIKQIEQPGSPLSEVKKYLLHTYDHSKITRKSKNEPMTVEQPVLSCCWLNTIEGFIRAISEESLEDGFSQRFLYVYANKDSTRPMESFSQYPTETIQNDIQEQIEATFNTELHEEYEIPKNVVDLWKSAFAHISNHHFDQRINESFYRRVLFRCYTYSVIYHLIMKKESKYIDQEDMTWALRVALFHLHSLENLLKAHKQGANFKSEVDKQQETLNKIKSLTEKKGKKPTAREVCRSIYSVKSSKEANEFLEILYG